MIDVPPATVSYMTVNLDGSLSGDSSSTLSSYQWSQTSGPTVTIANASSATASFVAPQVTAATSLSFSLKVTDQLGTSNSKSATITVNPATGGQLTPSFVGVRVLRAVSNNPHLNAVPVSQSLVIGASLILQVTLTGAVQSPTLTLEDGSGNSLGTVPVTAVGDPSQQPLNFIGTFTVPAVPFQVVASGTAANGQAYSLPNPAPAGLTTNLVTPQTFGVSFPVTHVRLSTASPSTTLQATINNAGTSAVTLIPVLQDPVALDPSQDSATIPSVSVAAGATTTLSFTLQYPANPSVAFSSFSLILLNSSSPAQAAIASVAVLLDDVP